ncbi:2-nitropropane dioxygenase [Boeremia exigua]|uniref:2-nitropropane dioxygenase n=1 Tax=Boeremia exigua TaxID=749465 RepID=UPI001E8DC581|nr:2-nitropropane dioxygenase [Boeremia exigua]KAH6644267.1 2-nitropropane dioxygenase [Boeremia exigua]
MPTPQETLPWTSSPLIINAPMAGFAGAALASTVTLAGGIGLIGSATNLTQTRQELLHARTALADFPSPSLPIGVGFLLFAVEMHMALELVTEFEPAVVWLFAAKEEKDYTTWTTALRAAAPRTRVWIQLNSVSAAVRIALAAKPDALCLQGTDAGGHGSENGAGIISLVPETVDALSEAGCGDVGVLASGGIVDGRGVASAIVLGAQGVVMGTRFLAASETMVKPQVRASVMEAQDGGVVTARSQVFDLLAGPSIWPEGYDGRSLAVRSYREFVQGVELEEIQKRYGEAMKEEHRGLKTGLEGRAAIWAGTGVGLVKTIESAKDIVEGVRNDARKRLSLAAKY